MVVKKIKTSDIEDLNTKQRIMESAVSLFALKGFDGSSVREIASLANVNVAAVNYHFKSKENLRQEIMEEMFNDFKKRINSIPRMETAAQYAVKLFEAMTSDSAQCVNRFKMILEAENHPCEREPYPIGFEEFSFYLGNELNKSVPQAERMWLLNIIFSYVMHISVMSSTNMGKKMVEKFFPKKHASIPHYIEQMVTRLIRDLNREYP